MNFLGGLNEERAIPETFFDVTSDAVSDYGKVVERSMDSYSMELWRTIGCIRVCVCVWGGGGGGGVAWSLKPGTPSFF